MRLKQHRSDEGHGVSKARTRGRGGALALTCAAVLSGLLAAGTAVPTATGPGATTGQASSVQELLDQAGHDGQPFDPELAAVTCPIERGPVKEGSDADRYKVSTALHYTSVSYLRGRPKPLHYPQNNRIPTDEDITWTVNSVYLTQYKIESDGDLHLLLKDSAGRTLVTEIPYGPCVPTTSRWKTSIAGARATFTSHYAPTTSWKYTHRLLNIRGIGFFDVYHGQLGAAPNGIELHPVTGLTLR